VRYAVGMVIVAFAALAATLVPPAPTPVSPGRQATATVTILASASLRFSNIAKNQPKSLHEVRVRSADGSVQTVKLVEFE
jgi:ABC-type molybdate transport system substrate-binding protein